MDRAVITKEQEAAPSKDALSPPADRKGGFARGFVVALPLSIALWLLIIWLV